MSELPTHTQYQALERLAALQDIVRVAFGEVSARNDARGSQADLHRDRKLKQIAKDRDNVQFLRMVSRYYTALFDAVMQRIEDIQANILAAIMTFKDRLDVARAVLANILETAARLPDNTPVFRYEDGSIKTDEGRDISADEAASIEWRGDEPVGELFERAKQTANTVKNDLLLLRSYDIEMQDYADKAEELQSEDTPENRLALQEISQQVSKIDKEVGAITTSEPEASRLQDTEVTIPKIELSYFQ